MPGEVNELKRDAGWTRVTERAVRCDWCDQAARESVQVPWWFPRKPDGRDLPTWREPVINLHVAKQASALRR